MQETMVQISNYVEISCIYYSVKDDFTVLIPIINREAGDKNKGSRLQKLRAIYHILDNMSDSDNVAIYTATELYDDVYLKEIKADGTINVIIEGDKNYNPDSAFTFHSDEVKNSIIILIDCWMENQMDNNILFCFYTNAKYGKENTLKGTPPHTLPDKAILRQLKEQNFSDPKLLPYIKKIILEYYEEAYKKYFKNKATKSTGYLESIKKWTDQIWIEFLKRIDWQFERENHVDLEKHLLTKIQTCNPFPSSDISGNEPSILASLLDEMDKRQDRTDFLSRLLQKAEVENIYLREIKHIKKKRDPVHQLWEKIPSPVDKRGLTGKIESVCAVYDMDELEILARRACEASIELDGLTAEESSTYKYRVYMACKEIIKKIIRKKEKEMITPDIIDEWIEELVSHTNASLVERSKDYHYGLTNRESLKNTVLYLIDLCYLAFDEGEKNGIAIE